MAGQADSMEWTYGSGGTPSVAMRDSLIKYAHLKGTMVLQQLCAIGSGGSALYTITLDSVATEAFCRRIAQYVSSHKFDGVDINWETSLGNPTQTGRLFRRMRANLNAVPMGAGGRAVIHISPVSAGWSSYDAASANANVDQINPQEYDLSAAWNANIGANGNWFVDALHKGTTISGSSGDGYDTRGPLQWIAAGFDRKIMGAGIANMGRMFVGSDQLYGGPYAGWGEDMVHYDNVRALKALGYQEIYDAARHAHVIHGTAAASYNYRKASFSAGESFWYTYQDPRDIPDQVQWVKDNSLGGVMLYDMTGDMDNTAPPGSTNPLINAFITALGTGGSTPDVTKPVVGLTSPANGAKLSGTVAVAATATDNIGVSRVDFLIDGSVASTDLSSPYAYSWNASSLTGNHTVAARAYDAAGNNSTSTAITVSITAPPPDTTKPAVALTSPANGSMVSGLVTVNATATDNIGVTKVDLLVNGTVVGSDAASPYTFSWNTSGLTGNQTITAKAYDAAGNVGTSAPVTVGIQVTTTVDQWIYQDAAQPPWIDASWNSTNTFGSLDHVYAGSFSLKAVETAWGGVAMHSGTTAAPVSVSPGLYARLEFAVYNTTAGLNLNVLFENDLGQSFTSVQQNNVPINQWTVVSIPMSQLDPSGYVIHNVIIQNYTALTSTFYLDNIRFVGNSISTVPSVPALTLPATGASNQPKSPTLNWSASSGATSYCLQLSANPAFTPLIVNDSALTVTSRQVTALAYSTPYYWRVNAKNSNGKSAYSTPWSFTTMPQPDTTRPIVAVTSPKTGANVSGIVGLTATSSDNVGVTKVEFLVNGTVVGSDTTSPYTFSWNTSGLTGNQTISAKAYDAAGNVGTSSPVTVGIQGTATADRWVYQDALQSPWIDVSWNSTNTFGSLDHLYAGVSSLKAVAIAWGGVSMRSGAYTAPVDVSPGLYARLEFAVYNTTAGLNLNVLFENDLGQTFTSVQQNNVPVNQWTVVSIPMSQLDPGGYVIHKVIIQNYTSLTPTFYLANIRFVGNNIMIPQTAPDVPVQESVHDQIPTSYALQQNFPNPFNPSTTIEYSLPDDARVSMKVYNSLGEEIAILVDGIQTAGYKSVTWDGSRLSSGLYFCRLTATSTVTNETFTQTKRMLLVK